MKKLENVLSEMGLSVAEVQDAYNELIADATSEWNNHCITTETGAYLFAQLGLTENGCFISRTGWYTGTVVLTQEMRDTIVRVNVIDERTIYAMDIDDWRPEDADDDFIITEEACNEAAEMYPLSDCDDDKILTFEQVLEVLEETLCAENENMCNCVVCGANEEERDLLKVENGEDTYICEDCLEKSDTYKQCSRCGEVYEYVVDRENPDEMPITHTTNYEDEYVCSGCREDGETVCHHCLVLTPIESLYHVDNDDVHFICFGCADNAYEDKNGEVFWYSQYSEAIEGNNISVIYTCTEADDRDLEIEAEIEAGTAGEWQYCNRYAYGDKPNHNYYGYQG